MYYCPPNSPCLLHPLMYCYMERWVPLLGIVCCIHLTSGCTPWLECVHTFVHVYMSIWLPMSTQTGLHSYMETWVPLWGSVFVSHSPYFCSHDLYRMCTCISTCTSVYLTPNVCFTPFAYLHGKMGSSVWHCVCLSVIYFWSHTLFKMCTFISTSIYALTWLPMSAPPHLNSLINTWVSLCDFGYLSQSAYIWSQTLVRMCICISTCFMSIWLPISVWHPMHSYIETWMPLCTTVWVFW